MTATRTNAGAWEKFTVVSQANGMVSFKGSNGKFVSHENGTKAMNCNRDVAQDWEKFTLVSQGGNVYAIKGSNGKYVSHENGSATGITCTRNAVGSWEKFIIDGLANRSNNTSISKEITRTNTVFTVGPNPLPAGNYDLQINSLKNVNNASIKVVDLTGKTILQKNLGTIDKGTTTVVSLNKSQNTMSAGLYIVTVNFDGTKNSKKIIVK